MAELWVGTHPAGQGTLPNRNDCTISELLRQAGGIGELPFLYKVLSISRALSIQVHPDKNLAEMLHRSNPEQYPDANDKPEMVVALKDMRLLHGVRPLSEISYFVELYPQLNELWNAGEESPNAPDSETDGMQSICAGISNLMSVSEPKIEALTIALQQSLLKKCQRGECLSEEEGLFFELNEQHSHDPGAWFVFILNIKKLRPFESLLISPNEPHSYISGDCLEAMKCSDNVIRIGLTNKFRDTQSFLRSLSRRHQCDRGFVFLCATQSQSVLEYIPAPVQLFPYFRMLVVRLHTTVEVKLRMGTSQHVGTIQGVSSSAHFQVITIVHEGAIDFVRDERPPLELPRGTVWMSCCENVTRLHLTRTEDTPALIAMCIPNTLRVAYED
ncbi:mannose-6-phosphate isomerase [Perkinsela sp. CCAP 1560/4]|nr:mannose-6-phosphate isomerase [Perkinsela sp. CCAP 1560/4]|eukprot:KNH09214.1 mannose-6-phosphate isomerase [Perkinsela sp. CCAP 1560/4]